MYKVSSHGTLPIISISPEKIDVSKNQQQMRAVIETVRLDTGNSGLYILRTSDGREISLPFTGKPVWKQGQSVYIQSKKQCPCGVPHSRLKTAPVSRQDLSGYWAVFPENELSGDNYALTAFYRLLNRFMKGGFKRNLQNDPARDILWYALLSEDANPPFSPEDRTRILRRRDRLRRRFEKGHIAYLESKTLHEASALLFDFQDNDDIQPRVVDMLQRWLQPLLPHLPVGHEFPLFWYFPDKDIDPQRSHVATWFFFGAGTVRLHVKNLLRDDLSLFWHSDAPKNLYILFYNQDDYAEYRDFIGEWHRNVRQIFGPLHIIAVPALLSKITSMAEINGLTDYTA